jgi:hypothetical protein
MADYVRWELHRVWVVEATLAPGKRHVIPRRRFGSVADEAPRGGESRGRATFAGTGGGLGGRQHQACGGATVELLLPGGATTAHGPARGRQANTR